MNHFSYCCASSNISFKEAYYLPLSCGLYNFKYSTFCRRMRVFLFCFDAICFFHVMMHYFSTSAGLPLCCVLFSFYVSAKTVHTKKDSSASRFKIFFHYEMAMYCTILCALFYLFMC